ncbi:MAG: biotin--[acetyl-CoA-carboxylase] ligase [Ignavibacteriales bacterium]
MDKNIIEVISKQIANKGCIIGSNILYHDVLESTMLEAKNLAKAQAEEGTIVIAGMQTVGRGRMGRSWISPDGGIWMSIILYPKISPAEVPLITLSAGTAVCTVVEQLYHVYPGLKWPNDVLLNGKKICGILTEGSVGPIGIDYSILGIGLNLNFEIALFPDEIKRSASTVYSETGINFKTEEVLKCLLLELDKTYKDFTSNRKKIISLWESYSITLGKKVSAIFDTCMVTGTALRITEKGNLVILSDETGLEIEIDSGEVSIKS